MTGLMFEFSFGEQNQLDCKDGHEKLSIGGGNTFLFCQL